jgi:hypothetical protein
VATTGAVAVTLTTDVPREDRIWPIGAKPSSQGP